MHWPSQNTIPMVFGLYAIAKTPFHTRGFVTMKSQDTAVRIFGIFFILSFVSYGVGNGLIESIVNVPDILSSVYANKTKLIIGVILMAVIHTFFNIGLPAIMLPLLKPYNKHFAYGYFGAAIIATVTLTVGAIFLLLLLPLSDEYIKAGAVATPYFETLVIICKKASFFAYQIGMAIWGMGGLMFCYLLYQSRLIPRAISIWGYIGYIIFVSGTILELFGHKIGLELSIPGGLFEIFLSIWLIIKGFNYSKFKPKEV